MLQKTFIVFCLMVLCQTKAISRWHHAVYACTAFHCHLRSQQIPVQLSQRNIRQASTLLTEQIELRAIEQLDHFLLKSGVSLSEVILLGAPIIDADIESSEEHRTPLFYRGSLRIDANVIFNLLMPVLPETAPAMVENFRFVLTSGEKVLFSLPVAASQLETISYLPAVTSQTNALHLSGQQKAALLNWFSNLGRAEQKLALARNVILSLEMKTKYGHALSFPIFYGRTVHRAIGIWVGFWQACADVIMGNE
ncbi:MAG: hypothetical protein HY537_02910 [Deltaproteobacteria bacterium]|nr:hypothetical protein [Deltaproteobacteria bacterium]